MSAKCAFCGILATLKCSGCKNVFYCTKEHQKLDWKKTHKNACKCFEIVESAAIGRYMRAIRNVAAGEIILREMPLVHGPKVISTPICLGCHKYLQPIDIPVVVNGHDTKRKSKSKTAAAAKATKTERNFYKCSTCKWPLCGSQCEQSPAHLAECQLMADKKFQCSIDYVADEANRKESAYCAIVPLRCLLLKASNPTGFQAFFQLQDHLKEHLKSPVYSVLKSNLITFFKTILSLDEFDETTILRTASILDTNSFELRFASGRGKIRAVYPTAAMMSHDCVPNTYHVFDDSMQMIVRASVDITKGDVISTTYGQALQSTMQRRIHLRQSKLFDCMCQRCRDPSECDTFIGSMVCPRCTSSKLVSNDPLVSSADWMCASCSFQMDSGNYQLISNRLQFAIENIPKHSPYDFELFLEKYCHPEKQMAANSNGVSLESRTEALLHEKNTFVLQIKYALTQLYGNVTGFKWDEICDTDICRKISLCNELLDIAASIEPGANLFRARVLLDLQDAQTHRTRRQFKEKDISAVVAHEQFNEQMDVLNEASGIFGTDAIMEPILKERMKQINTNIQQMKLPR